MPRKAMKGKPTSIRLMPETEEYLMRCQGKTITDKFEYLVHFCMTREEMLKNMETDYQKRYEAYEEVIKRFQEVAERTAEMLQEVLDEAERTFW